MAGHVVGGCIGFALGGLAGAVVILTITGIGPVVAIGTLVFGSVIGSLIGAVAGAVLQQTFRPTLSYEDLLVFQDARRRGHEILIVEPSDEVKAETVQQVFREIGADNTDEAWDHWWTRLRESQAAAPGRPHDGFSATDIAYLRGFEAALDKRVQGCSADQAATILDEKDLTIHTEQPFRRGYKVGQAYQRVMREQAKADTLATET
jgi:outer membrane lipoprotein SlyB